MKWEYHRSLAAASHCLIWLILVTAGAGAFLVQFISNVSLTYVGQKLTREVRVVLFGAMLQQEIGWYGDVIFALLLLCPSTMAPAVLKH